MTAKNLHEPWLSFFLELDEAITEETHLYCLGGFIVTVLDGTPRATADIVRLRATPKNLM